MNCKNCKSELSADSKFCPSCGAEQAKINNGNTAESATAAEDSKAAFITGYVVFGALVVGGWWKLANHVEENILLLNMVFGSWMAFAAIGFARKWSALVSFGGGFVGGMAILAAWLTMTGQNDINPLPAGESLASVGASDMKAGELQAGRGSQHFEFSMGTGEWFSEIALSALAGDSDRRYLVIKGKLKNASSSETFVNIVCTALVKVKFENGKTVDISSEDICGDAGGAALAFMTGDSSAADRTRLKLKPGETHKINTSTGGKLTAAMVSPLLNEMYASYPVSAVRLKIEVTAETPFGDRVKQTVLQTSIPSHAHKAAFNLK